MERELKSMVMVATFRVLGQVSSAPAFDLVGRS
jgi:hypothetical protein